MITRIALALIVLSTIAVTGCCGATTVETTVEPTWISTQVEDNTVSIPASEVDSGKMLHFRVTSQDDSMAFMAYKVGGEIYVRANVCPPRGSVGFSLAGDTLVCENCGTRFEASTGNGIDGYCVSYPKARVAHEISGDKVTLELDDLVTAHENTMQPGRP